MSHRPLTCNEVLLKHPNLSNFQRCSNCLNWVSYSAVLKRYIGKTQDSGSKRLHHCKKPMLESELEDFVVTTTKPVTDLDGFPTESEVTERLPRIRNRNVLFIPDPEGIKRMKVRCGPPQKTLSKKNEEYKEKIGKLSHEKDVDQGEIFALRAKFEHKEDIISDLRDKCVQKDALISTLRHQLEKNEQKILDIKKTNLILRKSDTLVTKMKALIGYHFGAGGNTEKKAKEVAEVFSSEDILSGMVCVYASEYARSPYTPDAVLKNGSWGWQSKLQRDHRFEND